MSKGKKGNPAKRAAKPAPAPPARKAKTTSRAFLIGGIAVAVLLVAGVAAFAVGLSGGGSDDSAQTLKPTAKLSKEAAGDLNACAGQVQDAGRQCYTRQMKA